MWWNPFSKINENLDRILTNQAQIIALVTRGNAMASQLDAAITQLQSDVTALTTVDQSAIALINGIAAQVSAAVAAALAAGATPAELQSMTDLDTALKAQASGLAAAVTANTPAPQAKKP
jgi:small-conductance mechanosensitive channel